MAKIWIPALLQDLTEGHQHLDVPGETVRDVIMLLEEKYPGIAHRLIEDGKIRPGMSVVVDNTVSPLEGSETVVFGHGCWLLYFSLLAKTTPLLSALGSGFSGGLPAV